MSISPDGEEYNSGGSNVLLASGCVMKIDTALTADLGSGSKRRLIAPHDAQVEIPSAIHAVVDIITPLGGSPLASPTPNEATFFLQYAVNKNNTVAWNDQVITLAPGYWELRFSLFWNFVVATALSPTQTVLVFLQAPSTFVQPMWNAWIVGSTGNVQQYSSPVLLRDNTDIHVSGPATAAGDTLFFGFDLNALKRI